MKKLLLLRIAIISFITLSIASSYKIENESEFIILIGGIMMGVCYFFVELISYEESKNQNTNQ